jgi:hypothetical protein
LEETDCSLAIKARERKERGGGITRRRKSDKREKKKNWGTGGEKKSRTGKKQNRGRAKFVPLFLLKETGALGAVPW